MAFFGTDLEALLFISLMGLVLFIINKYVRVLFDKTNKIPVEKKNKINFVLRLISVTILIYFILEGFPIFGSIDPIYTAVLTGSISTAFAFASSEIFVDIVSGIILFISDPFDLGHIVKIKGKKGIIRSISLTRVVIETFDGIIIQISNSDIVSSKIINYTIELHDIKRFYQLKKRLQSPQEVGKAWLHVGKKEIIDDHENQVRAIFEIIKKGGNSVIHNFTFKMQLPYKGLRIKIHEMNELCEKYLEIFGIKPTFHVIDLGPNLTMKFRIMTLDSQILLDQQPKFAKDLYLIISD